MKLFIKKPVEEIDYDLDFGPWLDDRVDTIDTSRTDGGFEVYADDGIEIVSSTLIGGKIVRILMARGRNGRSYKVVCNITTVGNRRRRGEMLLSIVGTGVAEGAPIGGGSPFDDAVPGEVSYGGGSPLDPEED